MSADGLNLVDILKKKMMIGESGTEKDMEMMIIPEWRPRLSGE